MSKLAEVAFESKLFEMGPTSDFSNLLDQCREVLEFAPEIAAWIELDQIRYGIEKKANRLEDSRYIESLCEPLPGFCSAYPERPDTEKLVLLQGRPRMDPRLVYYLMMIQGYLGSLTAAKNYGFLIESTTFAALLYFHGWKLPSRTAINDNLNKVSVEVHERILEVQTKYIMEEGLDDFRELTVDSTSVRANSKWPTDSGIITDLLQRCFQISQRLEKFGVLNFRPGWGPRWVEELKQLNFQINVNSKRKRRHMKRLYKRLLDKAEKFCAHFLREFQRWNMLVDLSRFMPTRRKQIETAVLLILEKVDDVQRTIANARDRLFGNVYIPASEKVLSTCDPDAAYIQKGGRDPVVGYKPQVVRSRQGFIPYLCVPQGNAADSKQAEHVVERVIKSTGVIPHLLSFDDGYAAKKVREALLQMGIEDVSISGSKGKRIIPEEDWDSETHREARRNRSAVESLMSVLKGYLRFGQMSVRGLDKAHRSMLQIALAYNMLRCIQRKEEIQKLKAQAA